MKTRDQGTRNAEEQVQKPEVKREVVGQERAVCVIGTHSLHAASSEK